MGISISTLPSVILSKIPTPVLLESDTFGFFSSHSEETYIVYFNGPITDGEYITFDWQDENGNTIEERLDATSSFSYPDGGNKFLHTGINYSSNVQGYYENYLPGAWMNNRNIAAYWIVTYDGTDSNGNYKIKLTSRAKRDHYLTHSTNMAYLTGSGGSSGNYPNFKTNHQFVLDIYFEETLDSGDFKPIISLTKPPLYNPSNSKAYARFFIHSILDNDLLEPELPDYDQTSMKKGTRAIKNFYLGYTEKFGSTPEYKQYSRTITNTVMRGMLEFLEHNSLNALNNHYKNSQFLTREPASQEVAPEQKEYLHYLVDTAGSFTADYKAKLYFDDGSEQTTTIESNSMSGMELWYMPAGFKDLSLDQVNTNKTVKKYEVWLEFNGSAISDTRTYVLDRKYYRHQRYFLFENMLGGFDTLRCTGRQVSSYKIEKSINQRSVASQPAKEEAHYFVSEAKGRNIYEISTGHTTKQRIEYLKECLRSPNVYLIQEDIFLDNYSEGGLFLPVIVDPDSFELYEDDQNLYSLKFTYKEAFDV